MVTLENKNEHPSPSRFLDPKEVLEKSKLPEDQRKISVDYLEELLLDIEVAIGAERKLHEKTIQGLSPQELSDLSEVSEDHPILKTWARLLQRKHEVERLLQSKREKLRERARKWIAILLGAGLSVMTSLGYYHELMQNKFGLDSHATKKLLNEHVRALETIRALEAERQKKIDELQKSLGKRIEELEGDKSRLSSGHSAIDVLLSQEREKTRALLREKSELGARASISEARNAELATQIDRMTEEINRIKKEIGERITHDELSLRLANAKNAWERAMLLAKLKLHLPEEVIPSLVEHIAIQESTGKPKCSLPHPLAPGCSFFDILEKAKKEGKSVKLVYTRDGRALFDVGMEGFRGFVLAVRGQGIHEQTLEFMEHLFEDAYSRGKPHENPFPEYHGAGINDSNPNLTKAEAVREAHGFPDFDHAYLRGYIVVPGAVKGTTEKYVVMERRK